MCISYETVRLSSNRVIITLRTMFCLALSEIVIIPCVCAYRSNISAISIIKLSATNTASEAHDNWLIKECKA